MTTLITTQFGAESTAAEVVDGIDLSGRRVIVTGGASGIGTETTRALAPARVRRSRSPCAATPTRRSRWPQRSTATCASAAPLDLSDLAPLGARRSWTPLGRPARRPGHQRRCHGHPGAAPSTGPAWSMQFATNHVGHFALATGLRDALAASDGEARIVSVSSTRAPAVAGGVRRHLVRRARVLAVLGAYGQSKTANVLFAVGATDRWAGDGIVANALMPGGISTPLQRQLCPRAGWRSA